MSKETKQKLLKLYIQTVSPKKNYENKYFGFERVLINLKK